MPSSRKTNTIPPVDAKAIASVKASKNIILNFGRYSMETVQNMAAATLESAGFDPTIADPKVGDRMPDGTIYAGDSPETGKPMYTTPRAVRSPMEWKEARDYAKNLDAHGHKDWRLPTKRELAVLFNNHAAIGG